MPNKNLTDAEFIKALEDWIKEQTEVKLLTEKSITAKYPHCVLCGNGAILTKSLEEYDKLIADISDEAYKEFAERLKVKFNNITHSQPCENVIDEVLTEIQK